VTGRNVYVVVSTRDWAKRPVPEALRSALLDSTADSPS
jgi:acyl-CoA thioester hydrolase